MPVSFQNVLFNRLVLRSAFTIVPSVISPESMLWPRRLTLFERRALAMVPTRLVALRLVRLNTCSAGVDACWKAVRCFSKSAVTLLMSGRA